MKCISENVAGGENPLEFMQKKENWRLSSIRIYLQEEALNHQAL